MEKNKYILRSSKDVSCNYEQYMKKKTKYALNYRSLSNYKQRYGPPKIVTVGYPFSYKFLNDQTCHFKRDSCIYTIKKLSSTD